MTDSVLYLDIDGVLNPLSFSGILREKTEWDDFEDYSIESYSVALSKKMGKAIVSLGVRIVWLTTWIDTAYKVGDILGIPRSRYLQSTNRNYDWKLNSLLEDLAKNNIKKFIWIDDQINKNDKKFLAKNDCLIIKTEEKIGLTISDLKNIKDFLCS